MSKLTQIQQALLSVGGGEFQKLADAYLIERGYDRVNSIGSVTGANKEKTGTPDNLLALSNGKYAFAEHTTQQTGLHAKMMSDLAKCFDQGKTGIPVEKIERVIFCFNSKLDTKQESELANACQENGVNLELFGADAIAFDLYLKYPGLALDFLGVAIDTGQIVPPNRFVSLYNSNKLATRLDLAFHFREEEIQKVLDALEDEKLVVLSGRAGVGKSRLALEACKRFQETHPEYEVMCIYKRDRELWEDLQTWFQKTGNFLIFVDDANRVSRFEYVIDLLQHQREDQKIKVIATVRDYALSKVREAARPLGGGSEVELGPLTDEQIKGLIKDEYGICNYHYLERIANIARGNPRLAVMAAEVAKGNYIDSIHDVSDLYDSYFSSIREDLQTAGTDLENADLLKVAAIVVFFKAVDRTNEEMMNDIAEAFDIAPAAFWEAAHQLHEMEVLDLHEDEVVRISDQVLATYLFYLAVFKQGALNFGALLCHFFPRLRHRMIDSINPILSAFDSERIIDTIRPHVERTRLKLEGKGDEEGILHLLDVFWFVMPTDTLIWVSNRIAELDQKQVEIKEISFEKSLDTVSSPSLLSVLRPYSYADINETKIALDLMLRYLAKRPSETSLLLRVMIEDYGFEPTSDMRGFEVQQAVVDTLWARVERGELFFSRVYLAVAREYLNTHFESYNMKGDRVFQITRFDLPATPELASLREKIWQQLFTLFQSEAFQADVLDLIHHYSTSHFRVNSSEVMECDATHVLPFLASVLDPYNYWHCVILHDYLKLLESHGLKVPVNLRDQFRNDTYALSEILLTEWGDQPESEVSYEDYEKYKRDRLAKYTAGYMLTDYNRFFVQCYEIHETLKERNEYQLQAGVVDVLLELADRNLDLYEQVLQNYLELENPLRLNAFGLVKIIVEQRGADMALEFLTRQNYSPKSWFFHFHEALPESAVSEERLSHLYGLYESADRVDLPYRMDFMLKYLPLDSRVIAKAVAIILDKSEIEPDYSFAIKMMFNPHTEVAKRLAELFKEDFGLLKRAYFLAETTRHHSDYKGVAFDCILNLEPEFITDYITWKFSNTEHGWVSRHDDNRDYAFIWTRPDYQEIMERVVESVFTQEQESYRSINPYLMAFFRIKDESCEQNKGVTERQNAFLLRLFDERNKEVDFIRYLFGVITQFPPERRFLFVERFVQKNSSFVDFEKLRLEPSSWSSNGSWVPVLQGRVNYFKSLLPIMNSVDLLQHKQYIERQIQMLRTRIEQEKKSDFIGD